MNVNAGSAAGNAGASGAKVASVCSNVDMDCGAVVTTASTASGLDLCRRVRSEGLTTPIVMQTAHGEEAERVDGFDVGADDYVRKPFSLKELLARIRAMLRHRGEWSAERAEIDRDVRRAADVQRRLLPQNGPRVASLDYAACCDPARGIGGDYYDFIDLGGGRLGLLVADVSGKDITAALTMAALHALIRSEVPRFGSRCPLCDGTDRRRHQKAVRASPLFRDPLFGVTIVKVFAVDLAQLDRIYRILSIIGLGVTLLVTSHLYHRFRSALAPGAEENT